MSSTRRNCCSADAVNERHDAIEVSYRDLPHPDGDEDDGARDCAHERGTARNGEDWHAIGHERRSIQPEDRDERQMIARVAEHDRMSANQHEYRDEQRRRDSLVAWCRKPDS